MVRGRCEAARGGHKIMEGWFDRHVGVRAIHVKG